MADSLIAPPTPLAPPAEKGDHFSHDADHPLADATEAAGQPSEEEWRPSLAADFLPRGGISFLIAKHGSGATTLARTFAYGAARPDIFPPFWEASGSDDRVLYWMLTARSDPAWERRCRASFGPPAPWKANLTVAIGMPTSGASHQLGALIRQAWCQFAILDALPDYRLSFERLTEPAAVIPSLRQIAEKTECHILAILPLSARVRITAESAHIYCHRYGVDTIFLLRNHRGVRTLTIARAEDEESTEVILHLDTETGRVTAGDDWAAVVFAEGMDAIHAALAAGPCTERELEARVGGKRETMARTLRDLLAQGMITRTGAGRRGDPYRYHRSR